MSTSRKDILAALSHDPARQAEVAKQLGVHLVKRRAATAQPPRTFRSQGEQEYARQLALRKIAGEVEGWLYEPFVLRLAEGFTYKIDFLVVLTGGVIELVEFKGHEREDDVIKFKMAAELHPWFVFRMVKKQEGQLVTTRLLNAPVGGMVRT